MKINGDVIPVLLLVNIYVHGDTWAILFNDARTFFFNYYLGRRRWGRYFSGGGSYRRRRLLTGGDPE